MTSGSFAPHRTPFAKLCLRRRGSAKTLVILGATGLDRPLDRPDSRPPSPTGSAPSRRSPAVATPKPSPGPRSRFKAGFAAHRRCRHAYAALKSALGSEAASSAAAGPRCRRRSRADVRPIVVIGAIAGTAGMRPTFAAVEAGRTIALANKETLVCAGDAGHARRPSAMGTRGFCRSTASTTPSSKRSGTPTGRLHRADDADRLGRPVPDVERRADRRRHARSRRWPTRTGPWAPR